MKNSGFLHPAEFLKEAALIPRLQMRKCRRYDINVFPFCNPSMVPLQLS